MSAIEMNRPATPAIPPPAMPQERAAAYALIGRWLNGETGASDDVIGALDTLALPFGLITACIEPDDDDGPSPLDFDQGQLDESLRRVRCGQIDDALHHLERALPRGYGVIAETIARRMETRS